MHFFHYVDCYAFLSEINSRILSRICTETVDFDATGKSLRINSTTFASVGGATTAVLIRVTGAAACGVIATDADVARRR